MVRTDRSAAALVVVAPLAAIVLGGGCLTNSPPQRSDLEAYKIDADVAVKTAASERRVAYQAPEQRPKTIAFFPPVSCRSISDVTRDPNAGLVHDDCGVLITLLEEGAVAAGLEVVSWRNLVGDQRALDYAREAKVDMLVEINELTDRDPLPARVEPPLQNFALSEKRAGGDVRVSHGPDLEERCGDTMVADWELPAIAINAKFVTVSDGRVRGNYRDKVSLAIQSRSVHMERTFGLAETTVEYANLARWNWVIIGGVLTVGGLAVSAPAALAVSNGVDVFSGDDAVLLVSAIMGPSLIFGGVIAALGGLLEPATLTATVADETPSRVCREKSPLSPPNLDYARTRATRNKALEGIAKDLVGVVVTGT